MQQIRVHLIPGQSLLMKAISHVCVILTSPVSLLCDIYTRIQHAKPADNGHTPALHNTQTGS